MVAKDAACEDPRGWRSMDVDAAARRKNPVAGAYARRPRRVSDGDLLLWRGTAGPSERSRRAPRTVSGQVGSLRARTRTRATVFGLGIHVALGRFCPRSGASAKIDCL